MKNTKEILLTGASGFVGIHLLNKLIKQESIASVYVLSRHIDEGKESEIPTQFLQLFQKYDLKYDHENIKKIKVISGDITLPKLGMHEDVYQEVTDKVDVIYHIAAEVNHIKSYEELKKPNVDSVNEIIHLANHKKGKLINFISTMGAAVKKDDKGLFLEEFPDDSQVDIKMGYLRSKYEAEKLLADKLIRQKVNIFRLGYISASTKTGLGLYENNQLMLFIKSCIQLGYAPAIQRLINLTPIDFTTEVLGADYFMSNSNNVMHLVNTKEFISWEEIIAFLNKMGFPIEMTTLESWQKMLIKAGKENALYRMILTYRRPDADDHIIRFGKNINQYHLENIKNFCLENKVEMPKIKYEYLESIINHLVKVGFIPK